MILTPPKMIAVDVDGTLHYKGIPNTNLIEWLRKKHDEGFTIMLWSMNGEQHARKIADRFNITDLFAIICSKPGYIVDDMGWQWTSSTKVIRKYD